MPGGEETANSRLVVHRHMQIPAGDAHVGVPRRVPNLGKRPPAGKGMAYEGVATVVDRQSLEADGAEELACRAEALAERVPRERLDVVCTIANSKRIFLQRPQVLAIIPRV